VRQGAITVTTQGRHADGWVPEHFYSEVLALIRRQVVVTHILDEPKARAAVNELRSWRLHRAAVRPLLDAAWTYRHNMTAADALYVVLAEHLHASFLTDDHNLVEAPTFPSTVSVLRLPRRR
jgi:predicted nucleic acid-binding protein